ncbi:MAG: hypothetical protein ACLFU5_07720 [Thermoplasmata archaeon]
MLDKEAVKIRHNQCGVRDIQSENRGYLVRCLERAKKHVNKEEIEECFDRALDLENIRRVS